MLTEVGKYLRKLRIDRGEILRDMAVKLNVSSAFLSAVENGKKNMPDTWVTKLAAIYELSSIQVDELKNAILKSRNEVELNLRNVPDENRQLAISFARQFDSLDEETVKSIMRLLKRHEED